MSIFVIVVSRHSEVPNTIKSAIEEKGGHIKGVKIPEGCIKVTFNFEDDSLHVNEVKVELPESVSGILLVLHHFKDNGIEYAIAPLEDRILIDNCPSRGIRVILVGERIIGIRDEGLEGVYSIFSKFIDSHNCFKGSANPEKPTHSVDQNNEVSSPVEQVIGPVLKLNWVPQEGREKSKLKEVIRGIEFPFSHTSHGLDLIISSDLPEKNVPCDGQLFTHGFPDPAIYKLNLWKIVDYSSADRPEYDEMWDEIEKCDTEDDLVKAVFKWFEWFRSNKRADSLAKMRHRIMNLFSPLLTDLDGLRISWNAKRFEEAEENRRSIVEGWKASPPPHGKGPLSALFRLYLVLFRHNTLLGDFKERSLDRVWVKAKSVYDLQDDWGNHIILDSYSEDRNNIESRLSPKDKKWKDIQKICGFDMQIPGNQLLDLIMRCESLMRAPIGTKISSFYEDGSSFLVTQSSLVTEFESLHTQLSNWLRDLRKILQEIEDQCAGNS